MFLAVQKGTETDYVKEKTISSGFMVNVVHVVKNHFIFVTFDQMHLINDETGLLILARPLLYNCNGMGQLFLHPIRAPFLESEVVHPGSARPCPGPPGRRSATRWRTRSRPA